MQRREEAFEAREVEALNHGQRTYAAYGSGSIWRFPQLDPVPDTRVGLDIWRRQHTPEGSYIAPLRHMVTEK